MAAGGKGTCKTGKLYGHVTELDFEKETIEKSLADWQKTVESRWKTLTEEELLEIPFLGRRMAWLGHKLGLLK